MFEAFPNLRFNGFEIMIQFPPSPGVESTTVARMEMGVSLMWNSNQTGVVLTIAVDDEVIIRNHNPAVLDGLLAHRCCHSGIYSQTTISLREFDANQDGVLDDEELA